MRRCETAFVTVIANRFAAMASDAREAELAEHVGKYDECNSILMDMHRKLGEICRAFEREMDERQISKDFLDMRFKKC